MKYGALTPLPSQLYKTFEGPRYIKGHSVSMALIAMSSVIYLAFWMWFRRQNQRKLAGKEDHKVANMTEEEAEELGEDYPRFLYTY
jgi:hypothetical protein